MVVEFLVEGHWLVPVAPGQPTSAMFTSDGFLRLVTADHVALEFEHPNLGRIFATERSLIARVVG